MSDQVRNGGDVKVSRGGYIQSLKQPIKDFLTSAVSIASGEKLSNPIIDYGEGIIKTVVTYFSIKPIQEQEKNLAESMLSGGDLDQNQLDIILTSKANSGIITERLNSVNFNPRANLLTILLTGFLACFASPPAP